MVLILHRQHLLAQFHGDPVPDLHPHLLRLRGQGLPHLVVQLHPAGRVDVAGQDQVFLDLEEAALDDEVGGVLLAVDRPLLEARVHLGDRHGGRLGADGPPGIHVDRRFGDAEFQPDHIGGFVDRDLAEGAVAQAPEDPAGGPDPRFLHQPLVLLLPERPVDHLVGMIEVPEQVRKKRSCPGSDSTLPSRRS